MREVRFAAWIAWLLLAACLVPCGSTELLAQQAAESRTALVIGNNDYTFAPLANPTNDAGDLADALEKAGFEVELLTNIDRAGFLAAVERFGQRLKQRGGAGLFFFAGHGLQVGGENYLLPLVDGISGENELPERTIAAADVVRAMSTAGNDLNIVILDACRDNPFTGGTNGLSRIDSSASLFVSYSTSPGAVALDGEGRNSPFSKHLVLSLAMPGLNLEETFKNTLKGVYQETGGKQVPWLSSSFFGEFVFRSSGNAGTSEKPQLGAGDGSPGRQAQLRLDDPVAEPPGIGGVYRVNGSNPDGSRYRGILALAEDGRSYDFTWWIGSKVFRGSGERAGKMLVVDWNDATPVVYSFAEGGMLDGEWADGSATDRLEPFGLAETGAIPLDGDYSVEGRNADGSRYAGTLHIEGDGADYEFAWEVGGSQYYGKGTLSHGLMVVDWGSTQPIVYAVRRDGSLAGLWDGGRGSEIARPQ